MNRLRRQLRLTSLWLAALLFVGQIVAVVHATQHELAAQGHQPACEICIVAHGAGALPAVPHTSKLPQGSDQPLVAYLPEPIPRKAIERPRSRAPPALV